MNSLLARLVLANLLLLPLFLGGTGWYLERAFHTSLESASAERLRVQVLMLLAEAEFDERLTMPEALLEPRFNQPNSGLYAAVLNGDREPLWQSPSSLALAPDVGFAPGISLAAGQSHFTRSGGFYRYALAVVWQAEAAREFPLTFAVIEASQPDDAQLGSFRRSLLLWLGGAALALLVGQALVLAWGLRPLRALAGDIAAVESGAKDRLTGEYPAEVLPVTDSLVSLLRTEEYRRERTRNTLADLAHSLKTPLSVLRGADPTAADFSDVVGEQVAEMDAIVSYQLNRASGDTRNLLQSVALAPMVARLCQTMSKVYKDKAVALDAHIPADVTVRGDERDLMEVLGNLLDNAVKYAASRVSVSYADDRGGQEIVIEDDGPGVPAQLRRALLARGVRADTQQAGQGIGLAVAADIVQAYGGELLLEERQGGGTRARVRFGV